MKKQSRAMVVSIISILVISMLLSACTAQATKPLIYGVWESTDGLMSYLMRVDEDGTGKAIISPGGDGIFLYQYITYHNFYNPVSPDGKMILVNLKDSEGVWSMNLFPTDGSTDEPIFNKTVGTSVPRSYAGFSPDSKYFSYSTMDDQGNYSVEVVDLANSTTLPAVPNAFFVDYFPKTADLMVITLNADASRIDTLSKVSVPSGEVTPLLQIPEEQQLGFALVSPDGEYLYYYDMVTKVLYRMPAAGGESQVVYTFTGDNNSANFAPGTNILVLTEQSDAENSVMLYDQTAAQTLRIDGLQSVYLSFSTDGKYMAYEHMQTENPSLELTGTSGESPVTISDQGATYTPKFSPDSSKLVYIEYATETDMVGTLFISDLAGQKIQVDTDVSSFTFSQDGKSLLYFKSDTTNNQSTLYSVGLDGKDPKAILGPESGTLTFLN